jgi:plastocyanin
MDESQEQVQTSSSEKSNKTPLIIAVVIIVAIGGLLYSNSHALKQMAGGSKQVAVQGAKTTPIVKDTASPSAIQAEQTFTVTGANFSFDPKTMTVKKGDKVKVVFKNAEGFHDWNLDEFNAHTKKIKANEEDTVEFVADKTGTFEYYCSVGQHRQMGMKGTLTVE